MSSNNIQSTLTFRDLTQQEQQDYCQELEVDKRQFSINQGTEFIQQLMFLRSKETVNDLHLVIKEKEDIANKEKESLQLQVDYWKTTCYYHIRRELSLGKPKQILDYEQKMVHRYFKKNMAQTEADIAACEKAHQEKHGQRMAVYDNQMAKHNRKRSRDEDDHDNQMRHKYNIANWLRTRYADQLSRHGSEANRTQSPISSPEIVNGDKERPTSLYNDSDTP